MQILEEL